MKSIPLALSLALACGTVLSAGPPPPAGPASHQAAMGASGLGCTASAADADPTGDRLGTLARFEALPSDCLKTVVLHCSRAADAALLDQGSAAWCSIGYEALLRSGFGGDFQALVSWWGTVRP